MIFTYLRKIVAVVSAILLFLSAVFTSFPAVKSEATSFYECFELLGELKLIGPPLSDATITISAEDIQIGLGHPQTTGDCNIVSTKYPGPQPYSFQTIPADWHIHKGSLTDQTITSAELHLSQGESYVVSYHVCPSQCELEILIDEHFREVSGAGGGSLRTVSIPALSITREIHAEDSIRVTPQSEPVLPASAKTSQPVLPIFDGQEMCGSGLGDWLTNRPGLTDAKWVTVKSGLNLPDDYQLVEGTVTGSELAYDDGMPSHDFTDLKVDVAADPYYSYVSEAAPHDSSKPNVLHTEWEHAYIPEQYWPTLDDRVSMFGYWILDCGHGRFYTEIHPFLGVATQRARPILLPQNFYPDGNTLAQERHFGTNVYVPGIITDIWFDRWGGQATNGDVTSLHEPETGHAGQEREFDNPNPINRIFEFNIYLPPSPQQIMQELGASDAPSVPLYLEFTPPQANRCTPVYISALIGGCTPAADGLGTVPNPEITRVDDPDGVTYLHIALDFTNFKGMTYSSKITAGWAYPSFDNWQLQQWRLRVNSLDVDDDADPYLTMGCGDWGFWINTSNRDREWTKLFDGDGSVCDDWNDRAHITSSLAGNAPWQTGSSLGPDLLTQADIRNVWVRTNGYEEDPFSWAEIGEINDKVPLATSAIAKYSPGSCHVGAEDCEAQYYLNYEIIPLGGIIPNLTQEAKDLYNSMIIISDVATSSKCADGWKCFKSSPAMPYSGSNVAPEEEGTDNLEMIQNKNIAGNFNQDISKTFAKDPQWVDLFMKKLKTQIDRKMKIFPEAKKQMGTNLQLLKIAIPTKLWDIYLRDLDKYAITKAKLLPMEAGNTVFQIEAQNKTFDIAINGKGIQSLSFTQELRTIDLENDGTAGSLEISIPKELLSGTFTIMIDNEEVQPKLSDSGTHSRVLIDKPINSTMITIEGTNVIPEFPLAIVIMITAIGVAIVLSRYMSRENWRWGIS